KKNKKAEFFLLELDIANERLIISSYSKNQEEKAIQDYSKAEKINSDKSYYDVVLVGIDDAKDLEKTYPNYFADTKEFIEILKGICNKSI
ncbi:MAG: (p)ppGpp synthetase, partial [archaeon]|nr:(p)ppGpp synthetase [archaeon]